MPESAKKLSCEKDELFSKKDVESIKKAFMTHVEYSLAKDEYSATKLDAFMALAYVVRDHLIERWL